MRRTDRIFSYDFVRVVALVMVIAVHSLPSNYLVQVVAQPLLFCCNGIFFILSGHFALRERSGDSLGSYYYRKIRGIIIPIVVYTGVITLWQRKNELATASLGILKEWAKKLIETNATTHLWFVYTVFGFLLAAPFLAHFTARAGRRERRWFALLGIGYVTCLFAGTCTHHDFSWQYPFGLWLFLFCVDPLYHAWIEEHCGTSQLLLAAIGCNAASSLLCHLGIGNVHLFDVNPLYVIEAICLYELLLRLGERLAHSVVVSELAQHQFGIFIMHMFMLRRVQPLVRDGLPWPVSWSLVILGTLVAASIAVVVIDLTVVRFLQRLCDRLMASRTDSPKVA